MHGVGFFLVLTAFGAKDSSGVGGLELFGTPFQSWQETSEAQTPQRGSPVDWPMWGGFKKYDPSSWRDPVSLSVRSAGYSINLSNGSCKLLFCIHISFLYILMYVHIYLYYLDVCVHNILTPFNLQSPPNPPEILVFISGSPCSPAWSRSGPGFPLARRAAETLEGCAWLLAPG